MNASGRSGNYSKEKSSAGLIKGKKSNYRPKVSETTAAFFGREVPLFKSKGRGQKFAETEGDELSVPEGKPAINKKFDFGQGI